MTKAFRSFVPGGMLQYVGTKVEIARRVRWLMQGEQTLHGLTPAAMRAALNLPSCIANERTTKEKQTQTQEEKQQQ